MDGNIECRTCKKKKPATKFRMVSRRPALYSKDCLLCLYDKKEKDTPGARRKAAAELQAELALTRELAVRELARRKLLNFVIWFEEKYQAGWIHKDICARLERFMTAVEEGKEPRLMLFLPPRFGKSMLASNYFPSWILGHHPEWEIIATSYAISLPIRFSRRIRSRIRDRKYRLIFPKTVLDPESQSAEEWSTTSGGGFVAAGVGGGITGKGARILIFDDLLKDDQEADSETIREGVWDWVGSTAYTRLSPEGGGILYITTRWHDADPAGKFLDQEAELRREGVPEDQIENWEVVSYPAINDQGDEYITKDNRIVYEREPGATLLREKGSSLHPERFPISSLLKKKRTLQPRHWAALYQQQPIPDGGGLLKEENIRFYIPPMEFGRGYIHLLSGDLAISKSQTADYTVLGVGALDWNGDIYVRDVIRGRMDTYEIVESLVTLWKRYDCQLCGIEQGAIYLAIKPVLDRILADRRILMPFDEGLKPVTDKILRARPMQGMMQQGKVKFPQGQPWVEPMKYELLRFPGGTNDDYVDFLSWLVRMASRVTLPKPPKRYGKVKSWKDRLKELGREKRHFMAA